MYLYTRVCFGLVGVGLSLSACMDDPSLDTEAFNDVTEFRGLDDGLELHWSFEDHVASQITDLSGNGRHGTLNGGVFVSSPLGEAISLDGVNDYVTLTHLDLRAPALYGGVDGDFTISARVRVTDVDKYNTLCVGCGPFSTMYVGTSGYGAKLMAAINNQSGGLLWPLSTTTLGNDEWREVTMIVEGGVAARMYLDCQLDGQLLSANVGLKDFSFSSVGQSSNPDRWFGGEIDQFRVWSRALSEQDLAELCPQPSPLEQGLQLHWTFEDHIGNQITDISGNGHHGTLNGGAFVSSPNGEAVTLDGINDAIAFAGPRAPALYGGVDGDFTISARVRVADLNKYNTLCYGCGPSSLWYLGDPVYAGRMTAAFYNQNSGGLVWTASTPAIVEDKWAEVTMVVDGGVVVRNYLDCAFDSQLLSANIGLKDYGYSAIGSSANPAYWFGGEIDELRVWDRALPDAELEQLCGACLGPIHVDVDAPDSGDGRSWASAFNTVQAALDAGLACDSPEIWVAEGTYAAAANLPIASITAPVSIYAGFAGTEVARAQRDFVAHLVRFEDDVDIFDTAIEVGEQVRLDGFTIAGVFGAIQIDDLTVDTDETLVSLHNLVITGSSAFEGAGIHTEGSFGLEIVGCRFEDNQVLPNFEREGSAIYSHHTKLYIDDSQFIDNVGEGAAISDDWIGQEYGDWGSVQISNSVMSGNSGGAIRGWDVTATNTQFINNVGTHADGAAIYLRAGRLEVHDCTFTGNQAENFDGGAISLSTVLGPTTCEIFNSSFSGNSAWRGGAININRAYNTEYLLTLLVDGGSFVDNAATSFRGGAIAAANASEVTINGASFVGNSAFGQGGAAALSAEVATVTGASFVNNSAKQGGGVFTNVGDSLDILDSRFIGNEASVTGGGLWLTPAPNMIVTNTEFVGNMSISHGGGVYGRATFVASTFANNVAGGSGNGLFASGGDPMTVQNVAAWPDNLSAASMILDHSCIPQVFQPHTNDGSVFIVADPFAPDDLDLDGTTEFYLAPDSDCADIGGVVGAFDWTTMTTQASQCTDTTPLDAGVHYTPLFESGPC